MSSRAPAPRTILLGACLTAGVALSGCSNPFDAGQADSRAGEEPPPFGDIREEVFTAMLAADSVTITGEVEASDADLDDLFEGIEDDAVGDLRISGALDGTNSEMSFAAGGSSFTQRAVEGEEYFRGEDFAALLVSELDDDVAEAVSEDFIAELVADQWVQFTDSGDGSVFSAEDFITTWQSELASEGVAGMTAELSQHQGQDVWVYTGDGGETQFTVAASERNPYLLAVRDAESSYEFSDWNASEAPETPENVITLDEIFEAIAEDQGWSTDQLEDESTGEDENTDDEAAGA